MIRFLMVVVLFLALPAFSDNAPGKWQYAGENKGVNFYFKVTNECQESGAKVAIKLENTLTYAVKVTFRVVDPNWKTILKKDLAGSAIDASLKIAPEEGTSCHPFVDDVIVEPKET